MNISRIHHCSFLVRDLERSLHFYCSVLGLAQDMQRPDLGYPGAWLKVGSQQIHLMKLPDPCGECDKPIHGGRDRHVAFIIDDLQQLVDMLEREGVPYTRSKSGRQALFCRDPDENALEFVQQ